MLLVALLALTQPRDFHLIHQGGLHLFEVRYLKNQGRTGEPNIYVLTMDDVTDGTHIEAQVKPRDVPKRHRTDYVGKGTLRRPGTGSKIVYVRLECKGKTVSFRASAGGKTLVKWLDEEVERKDE